MHVVQVEAPARAKLPAVQLPQLVEPAGAKVPPPQVVQVDATTAA